MKKQRRAHLKSAHTAASEYLLQRARESDILLSARRTSPRAFEVSKRTQTSRSRLPRHERLRAQSARGVPRAPAFFARPGRRRADLDNHNGRPRAQERSQLQQRRRPVAQEGETRVVRGPEQGRAGVERQAARPGQRYAVERARERAAVSARPRRQRASSRRSNATPRLFFLLSRRFERFRRRFTRHFERVSSFVSPTRINRTETHQKGVLTLNSAKLRDPTQA